MTDKFYEWMPDRITRGSAQYILDRNFSFVVDGSGEGNSMNKLDDWDRMSEAERRRWAADKLEFSRQFAIAGGDQPVSFDEMFKRADLLIAYITSGSQQEPSTDSAAPQAIHSSSLAAEQSPAESDRAA